MNLEKLNKEKKVRRKRIKLGNIYEIPLPNGKKAYGRLYEDHTLAIYNKLCNSVDEIPEEDYKFFCSVYGDLLRDGEWPVVGFRKFESEEDAWPPPTCVIDALNGKGSLYYKGEIRDCSYEECKDLEITSVWDRHHLINKLMGVNISEKNLGKPIRPNEKKPELRHEKFVYGNIYEILLPNGKKAYGRLYMFSTLAIYEGLYDSVEEIPTEEKYQFFSGVTTFLLKDKSIKIVGNRKFENEEDIWAPPFCAVNIIDNSCCIYYKQEFIECNYEECKELEVITFLNKEELIDRLMGGNKWNKNLDKPLK